MKDDEANSKVSILSHSSALYDKFETSRNSWLLIPLILILIIVLVIIGEDAVWNPSGMIPVLNIVFITPISILISILAARSYLKERSLAVLSLGCGTLALGTGAALTMLPSIASVGNSIVTMYSSSMVLAAFCHLLSTISLSSSNSNRPRHGWPVLVISYILILAMVSVLLAMVLKDFWPEFFVAGSGQTNLGYAFLMSSVITFLISVLLLWISRGDDKGGFYYHYSTGLVLIAVGLIGVSLQSSLGDPLNWVGRSSQYIGIFFMLMAVISSIRHSGTGILPMERALRDSESRYQGLVTLSPNAILVIMEGRLIFVNPAAVSLFGIGSSKDLIGKDVTELIHPDSRKQTMRNLQRMQEHVVLPPWESKFIRFDGLSIDVEVSGSMVGFEKNMAVQAILRDITEHKRSDDALKESESKYRGLFENIQEAVVLRKIIYDEHGEIVDLVLVDANPAMLRIIGVGSIDDVKGKRFSEIYDPETAAWALGHVKKMMVSGRPFTQESHYRSNDRHYITTSVPLGKDHTFSTGIDITERKKAEEAIRESNELLEKLLDYANAPIIVWDQECIITRFNHAFEVLTGLTAKEAIGSELSMLFPRTSKESSMEMICHAMEGSLWDVVEIPIQHRSGEIKTVVWNSANILGTDSKPIATIAQGQDITERKKAEEALRETNEYLEKLIGYANAPIIVWDQDCVITRFNHAFEVLTGISADEAIGAELSMLFPKTSKGSSMELIHHAMGGTQWDVVEIPIQHRSGQIRAVVWNSANIMGNDSKPIATIAQGQDITFRKWAENALKESESKYRGLFENIQEAVVLRHVVYDEYGEMIDLELIDANPAHLKMLNARSIEEVRGGKYSKIYSESTVAWMLDHVRKVMTTGASITEEYYLDLNDRYYILTTTPFGKNHVLSTYVDITERKMVEAALKKSEKSLNDAQHMAHIGNWEWNVQTGEIDWSAELYSIYGVKPGKFTPSLRSFSDFIHPDDRKFVAAEIERLQANGGPLRFDFRIVSADGSIRILNATGETIAFDKEGSPSLIVGTNQDITDRKRAEDEVRRSNAELQQFAYVASHDLQEPLRMVVNYLNLLERRYEDQLDAKGKEYIQFAVDGGKRMRALIDDLLMYSRVDTKNQAFSMVDMNKVLEDTIKVLGVAIKSNNAEIIVHPLPTIMADRLNMAQIIQNVISNAIKFHGEERPKVEVSSSQTETEFIFSVKDNGIGIDPKYYNKLFQMFQRLHTRDEYEGTGIGLAISKKIIDRHGGRIWFESDGHNGSTLFFTIPKMPRSVTDE